GGEARNRVPATNAGSRRVVERTLFHGRGLSPHLLPALPRLSEILPAMGARALPQPAQCQQQVSELRDVIPKAGSLAQLTVGAMTSRRNKAIAPYEQRG